MDAITYLFLGYANTINVTVNLTNTLITPTQTKLTADAGNMQFNLTFLNPIEVRTIVYLLILPLKCFLQPGDWIKQSMPFSYVSLTAESLDGAPHDVQCQMYLGPGASNRLSFFRSVVSKGCCRMDVRGPVSDNYMVYHSQQRRRLPLSQPPKPNPLRGNCHSTGMGHITHCDEERAWKWYDLHFAAHG